MSDTTTSTVPAATTHKPGSPCWIDAATPDMDESIRFYTGLFGWSNTPPDPEAGGYSLLRLGEANVAGLGPLQEGQVAAWSLYFATPDAEATAARVQEAGGKVIAPPFDVLKSGRMAVFQDPTGAFCAVWQADEMPGFDRAYEPNTFGWAELNTRGVEQATDFYTRVFGWGVKKSAGSDEVPYIEWQLDGQSVGGAIDLGDIPDMSGEVAPYWLVYFEVEDIDAKVARVQELGGSVFRGPMDYPGGRLAIAADPLGPVFGLMQSDDEA
jgi:predicted enzyme related to lactoylglutathione lyase